MSVADIIVLVVVIGCISLALRYLRKHPLKDGCDGSCASCPKKDGCPSADEDKR